PKRNDYPSHPHDPPMGMSLPPMLLVALVVLIGLFPETIAGPLVRITAGAVIGGPVPDFHLAIWHGFTPALFMSIAAVAIGLFALWRYTNVRAIWQAGPHPDAKQMFFCAMRALVALSQRFTHGLHNGSLQRYLGWMIGGTVLIGLVTFFTHEHGAGTREAIAVTPVAAVGWLLLVGCCIATVC